MVIEKSSIPLYRDIVTKWNRKIHKHKLGVLLQDSPWTNWVGGSTREWGEGEGRIKRDPET